MVLQNHSVSDQTFSEGKMSITHIIMRHQKNEGDKLTPEGRNDAATAGLKFFDDCILGQDAIGIQLYHSPKNRALETARIFYGGVHIAALDAVFLKGAANSAKEEKTKIPHSYQLTTDLIRDDLLDVQGFTEDYRNDFIKPISSPGVWEKEGLLFVLKNDPAIMEDKYKGEGNKQAAARVAKHILNAKGDAVFKNNAANYIMSVTHGPLPEHFLINCIYDDLTDTKIEWAVDLIGGAFSNGDHFRIEGLEKKSGETYEIFRKDSIILRVNEDKIKQVASYLK